MVDTQKYCVMLYDPVMGWWDLSGPVTFLKADQLWRIKTNNGIRDTKPENSKWGGWYEIQKTELYIHDLPEVQELPPSDV